MLATKFKLDISGEKKKTFHEQIDCNYNGSRLLSSFLSLSPRDKVKYIVGNSDAAASTGDAARWMWRAVHSRKISGIGEKASKKRRAIVGIGLVVGARGRGKKEGSGGRKNGVVAGEGRGEESEGWRKRGEGKCGGFPGGNEPSGGDQWAAASFGGVCVRVSAEERLRYAPPRDPPGFAHTQDFGGESLKSGDQDAIGRSGSTV